MFQSSSATMSNVITPKPKQRAPQSRANGRKKVYSSSNLSHEQLGLHLFLFISALALLLYDLFA